MCSYESVASASSRLKSFSSWTCWAESMSSCGNLLVQVCTVLLKPVEFMAGWRVAGVRHALGLQLLPTPDSSALLRVSLGEALCASPPSPAMRCPLRRGPAPLPPRVPARRAAATRCQAGAGLPAEQPGAGPLSGVWRAGPANAAGLGRKPRKTANEGLVLLYPTAPSVPPCRGRTASAPFPAARRKGAAFSGAV